MPEKGPQNIGSLIGKALEGVGKKIGIFPSAEKQAQIDRQYEEDLQDIQLENKEYTKKIHILEKHTDLCTSEMEYVLGLSNYDPHQGHPVVFTECQHSDEEIWPSIEEVIRAEDGGY